MVRPLRSDHRRAKTSPRRAPLAAATSRNTGRHHGPVAHWVRRSCSDGSSAIPMRFLTFGRSLWVTGFVVASPHFEIVLYGWNEGGAHFWHGARNEGNVWCVPKPKRNRLHPTMKPVALIERAIRNSCQRGDLVLDLFGG